MTPKCIFSALNALFHTCGSNTSLLGISAWPGISKKHLKINMSKTEFLIPYPNNKRIISFYTCLNTSLNKYTIIYSFTQAKNLCHSWLNLPYSPLPIDHQVLLFCFKKHVSTLPITLYLHGHYPTPRHYYLLPLLFGGPPELPVSTVVEGLPFHLATRMNFQE